MKRGILVFALGHANYYRMAVVLAASIKANDNLSICLVTDKEIQPSHKLLFDIVKAPTKKSINQHGKIEFLKAKLFMYNLSPFQETIFLDVDQVLITKKKLTPVFDELKDIDITFSNTGPSNVSIWAKIEEVKELYGDHPFWNYHSEFVYFKKSDRAKEFFNAAIKIYEDGKIKSAEKFGGGTMADELAFQTAAIVTGIYPHQENWSPNFWFGREKLNSRKHPYELTNYLTYSIGGNSVPEAVKNNYNILAKFYFAKMGLANPYQVVDKRSYLPERNKV